MNGFFHAAAGATLGALVLGSGAAPGDLILCAVAGISPDGDGLLLLKGRETFSRHHRALTHGVPGVAAGALLAGGVAFLAGGDFARVAGLWLLGAGAHTLSDLFNRSGVALLAPFSGARTRFPAVAWGDLPLTLGACLAAAWAFFFPETARWAAAAALAGYAGYLRRRLRAPVLTNPLSRWWFGRVCGGFAPSAGEAAPIALRGRMERR